VSIIKRKAEEALYNLSGELVTDYKKAGKAETTEIAASRAHSKSVKSGIKVIEIFKFKQRHLE
jgi:hypothetical protein